MNRLIFCLSALLLAALILPAAAADEKPAAQPAQVTAPAEPADMVKLFNGTDLTGWDGDPRLWSVKDGAIRGESTKEIPCKSNTFTLCVDKDKKPVVFKDFELRLTFRIDHGNSGIQYRSKHLAGHKDNNWVVAGYQAEVENTPGKVGFLYHEKGRGYLVNVGDKTVIDEAAKKEVVGKIGDKAEIGKTYKKSDWNDYIIICKGNHIVHYLNGVQTIDLVDNDPKGRAMEGILALQMHSGGPMVVEFKNIRVKDLEAK